MQSHFLPSVRVAAPRDEPNLSTLARFLRSDFLESKETPTKSRDTGLPSSLQLLLFQLSVTSTLQTLSEKDTGRGSFQHHYLSASRYCSKLPWLPVPEQFHGCSDLFRCAISQNTMHPSPDPSILLLALAALYGQQFHQTGANHVLQHFSFFSECSKEAWIIRLKELVHSSLLQKTDWIKRNKLTQQLLALQTKTVSILKDGKHKC